VEQAICFLGLLATCLTSRFQIRSLTRNLAAVLKKLEISEPLLNYDIRSSQLDRLTYQMLCNLSLGSRSHTREHIY
jgi:hypothetical protein